MSKSNTLIAEYELFVEWAKKVHHIFHQEFSTVFHLYRVLGQFGEEGDGNIIHRALSRPSLLLKSKKQRFEIYRSEVNSELTKIHNAMIKLGSIKDDYSSEKIERMRPIFEICDLWTMDKFLTEFYKVKSGWDEIYSTGIVLHTVYETNNMAVVYEEIGKFSLLNTRVTSETTDFVRAIRDILLSVKINKKK